MRDNGGEGRGMRDNGGDVVNGRGVKGGGGGKVRVGSKIERKKKWIHKDTRVKVG